MDRQRPENMTTWRSVSYEYTTHDIQRGQIWVFSDVLRALGVEDPDGQRVYVAMETLGETPVEAPKYCGEMTMGSGQEIYGPDRARAVKPNSRVRVMVSLREGGASPGGKNERFGWGDGDIVITKRPREPQE